MDSVQPKNLQSTGRPSVGNHQCVERMWPCKLYFSCKELVARGRVILADGPQMIHGKPLREDFYNVVIDIIIKGDAELPEPDGYHSTLGFGENRRANLEDLGILTGREVGKFIQLISTFVGGFVVAFVQGWLLTLVMLSSIPLLVLSSAAMAIMISKMVSRGQTTYTEEFSMLSRKGENFMGRRFTSLAAQNMRFGIAKAMKRWEKGLQPNMKEIESAQALVDSLLNARNKLVVIDFFSPGCGGCKAIHPKICQIAEQNPDVQFLQQKALEAAMNDINSSFGKGSVTRLGSASGSLVETFPSSCLMLDFALGGDLPKGRIVEVISVVKRCLKSGKVRPAQESSARSPATKYIRISVIVDQLKDMLD